MQEKYRPIYLNLFQIRLPIPGIVSIAHRLSGVLMFLAIPIMAYILHLATQSEQGYQQVLMWLDRTVVKFALIVLAWSLLHHLLAGIRYLFIDMDIGVDKPVARKTAAFVMATALVAVLIIGITLL